MGRAWARPFAPRPSVGQRRQHSSPLADSLHQLAWTLEVGRPGAFAETNVSGSPDAGCLTAASRAAELTCCHSKPMGTIPPPRRAFEFARTGEHADFRPIETTGRVMNNMGVFAWIRESVRRSVLLGFSDAVEQLGASAEGHEQLHPQLAAVLREAAAPTLAHDTSAPAATASRSNRKRLGRSLEQLRRPGKPNDDIE